MKGIWLLLLLAGPASAQELTNAEACVQHAMTLISGQPVAGNTEGGLAALLKSRGETCADPAYAQAASERVRNLQWQAQLLAQSQQEHDALQARLEQEQRDDRAERIRAAGRAYLQMQQQQRPTTTSCRQTLLGMDCTTR